MSAPGPDAVRIAVDVRGYSAATRGTDVYAFNLLRRWDGDHRVAVSLIRTRTGPAPEVGVDAPLVSLSFTRTLLQRIPGLARPLDRIGRSHHAVFLPNMAVYPRNGNAPLIVMAHDATALQHPRFFTIGDRMWHWLVNLRALMLSADRVLANSEQTKRELLSLGVSADRIKVIYLGIEPQYRLQSADRRDEVRAKYGIGKHPYFLYLGAVERRKNVAALINGFLEARRQGLDSALVIAGSVREPDQLSAGTADVKVLGWIDAGDKPALYAGATAVVSLATQEGFGFVPLEAFACGTPSILRRLPVYQETIGDLATYVDRDEPNDVAQALIDAQTAPRPVDPSAAERLRNKFSWDRCAAETLRVILETTTAGR